MSLVMRKPAFLLCENKDADQLHDNREADQRFCFRYTDSTIPLLPKDEISSFYPFCVVLQPGLCRTWSETPNTDFLTTRLIYVIVTRKLVLVVTGQVRLLLNPIRNFASCLLHIKKEVLIDTHNMNSWT